MLLKVVCDGECDACEMLTGYEDGAGYCRINDVEPIIRELKGDSE